jgi:uncharacterized membrane protein
MRLDTVVEYWKKISIKWRIKIVTWAVFLAISQMLILIWGPGVWLTTLIIVSFLGYFLYKTGYKLERTVENLLGKVWDYFRGAILFALIPPVWEALKIMAHGDVVGGVIQILILAMIAALVREQFNSLPRSWSQLVRVKSGQGTRRR